MHIEVDFGKKSNYLGATIDYSTREAFKASMTNCIAAAKKDFFASLAWLSNNTIKGYSR